MKQVQGIRAFAILMVSMMVLSGCRMAENGHNENTADPTGTAAASAQLSVTLPIPKSRLASALGTVDDVTAVTVEVRKNSDQSVEVTETGLTETSPGNWELTLENLPAEVALDFIGKAKNSDGTVIFSGTVTQTLVSGTSAIELKLASIEGSEPTNPKIVSAAYVEEIQAGSEDNYMAFDIDFNGTVTYTVSVTGSTGDPAGKIHNQNDAPADTLSGEHNPADGVLEFGYDAPATPGTYFITLTLHETDVTDRVATTFPITVVDTVRSAQLTVLFGPALTALNVWRKTNRLEITALTDPESGLTFAWSGTGAFSALTGTSRTAVIEPFTDTATGTVTITATDASNISASLTRTINAGDFPLIINRPPQIRSATLPEEVAVGSINNPIQFDVVHHRTVEYAVTAENGWITSGASGIHDPEDGLLEAAYDAPGTPGTDTITLTVTDPDVGFQVTKTYSIEVVEVVQSARLTVLFGPALTAMNVRRKTDRLEITAVADLESGLTYAWSGTDDFDDLAGTERTVVIEPFTDDASGAVTVTVTDASNLSATLTRTINAGDFPLVIDRPAELLD
jgi:vacuolar-type H+-ATPase subunit F/Vma7